MNHRVSTLYGVLGFWVTSYLSDRRTQDNEYLVRFNTDIKAFSKLG